MMRMNLFEWLKKHKIGASIFFLALVLRLVLFCINLDAAEGNFIDTIRGQDGYYEISRNLIDGNGFSFDTGPVYTPDPLRPPAWIFIMAFIAKLFGSYIPVFIFEMLIASFIPVLGMCLARYIVSDRLAFFVGILLALEPYAILLSVLTISETPFTFFLFISLLFLFKYIKQPSTRSIIWSAVFLGLAILVKPTVQFFPVLIPIALFLIFRKKISKTLCMHALYFFVISMLVISPWLYRNYKEFGVWGLSAQASFNLYQYLMPTVLAIDNGTDFATEHSALTFRNNLTGSDITLATEDYYIEKALSTISLHKTALVKSVGISMMTFFTHDGMLTVLGYAGVRVPNLLDKPALTILFTEPVRLAGIISAYIASPAILVLLGRLFWIAMTLLFLVGGIRYLWKGKVSSYALIALFIVAYFAFLTTVNGFGMNARFRVTVNVFIFTFAVYSLSALWHSVRTFIRVQTSPHA